MSKTALYSAVFCSLVCFTCLSYADNRPNANKKSQMKQNEGAGPEMGPHPMRVTFRHIEGRGIGYGDGYTSLTGFFAPNPEGLTVLPFVDLRGHVFDDGRFAANAGFGLRGILGDCWVLGGNAYYDFRNTKHQNFNQVSAGLEALHPRWEVRANGYLPVGRKTSGLYQVSETSTATLNSFVGHNALIDYCQSRYGKMQYAMRGVNSEVGYHVFLSKNYDVFVAAGPYYFNFDSKNAVGGKIRAAVKIFDYLTLEIMDSYDSRFKEIFQGQISVNIPFGQRQDLSKSKTFAKCDRAYTLNQRMVQDVERQEIIVIDRKRTTKERCEVAIALDPTTGDPLNFVFVNNTSHSDGTFESPYPTLMEAQNNSGPGNVIYVYAGDGTTTGYEEGIVLQDDQLLWGASTTHYLNTQFGPALIPPQSSDMPYITNFNNTKKNDVILIANNNEISGLNILVYNQNGISQLNQGISITNLDINNNVFEVNSGGNAVQAYNVGGTVNFSNNVMNLTSFNSTYESGGAVFIDNFVNDANYTFMNNAMWGGYGGIQVDLNNCSNITTVISGNVLNTGDGKNQAIYVYIYNGASASPHSFTINNNSFSSIGNNIYLEAYGSSQASFDISSNRMYASEFVNLNLNLYDNSDVNFNVDSNEIAGVADNIDFHTSGTSSSSFIATNNYMAASGDNIYVDAGANKVSVGVAFDLVNIVIENNNFVNYGNLGDSNIYIEQFNDSYLIGAINNNTFTSQFAENIEIYNDNTGISNYQISGNTFNGNGGFGSGTNSAAIYMETDGSSYMTANVTNNLIQMGNYIGIDLESYNNSQAYWNVVGNTFNANLENAAYVYANDASSTCLLFTNNIANPQVTLPPAFPAYQFINNNGPISKFYLQPLRGNTGHTESIDITNVSEGGCP